MGRHKVIAAPRQSLHDTRQPAQCSRTARNAPNISDRRYRLALRRCHLARRNTIGSRLIYSLPSQRRASGVALLLVNTDHLLANRAESSLCSVAHL